MSVDFDSVAAVRLRRGNAAERAAATPCFSTLPRLERPPEIYIGSMGGAAPAFVLGLLPEARIRYGGRDYFIEVLLLDESMETAAALAGAMALLAGDLGAGHFVTNYVAEDSAPAQVLQAAGFAMVAVHREMILRRADVADRLQGAQAQLSRWQGRGVDIMPITEAPIAEVGRVIAQGVGIIPDGYYVLAGELPADRDYGFSLAAMMEGRCCGALVAGFDGKRLAVESIVVAEKDQGTPVAGMLLLALFTRLAQTEAADATFRIAADNRGSLMLAQRLGAQPVADWLRLAWPRPADAPETKP